MKKQILSEELIRMQRLAGIKPLYEIKKTKEEIKWDDELSLSVSAIKNFTNLSKGKGITSANDEYNKRREAKLKILRDLNKKGVFDKPGSANKNWKNEKEAEEDFEEWIADNYLWNKIKKHFKK